MFIRSSTALNDCLIALDNIAFVEKTQFFNPLNKITIYSIKIYCDYTSSYLHNHYCYDYDSETKRDAAYESMCEFLNSNYKLRDFT